MQDDRVVNQTASNLVDKQLKNNVLSQSCLLCGDESDNGLGLCSGCINDLPHNQFACPVCALPTANASTCANCLNNKKPLLNKSVSLFRYQYPVNLIIQNIKFNSDLVAAKCLGHLLADIILEKGGVIPECIVPVPMHYSRLRQRGYNPALEIARPVASVLGLPIDIKICKRTRRTKPQTELTEKQRKQNVRNAFSIAGKSYYRHIAIVDDVMTTGSTINELARLLARAGTIKIDVWVCARASSHG